VPLRKEQGLFLLFSLTAPYAAPKKQPFFGWFFEWPWPRPLKYQGKLIHGTLCRSKETAMFSGLVLSMALAAASDVPEQVCFFF